MKNNPGFIKWFVSVVQAGKRPEEVFAKAGIFLEFCMSNVYHFLSDNARKVIRSMLSLPGLHSQAELVFLNDIDALELQRLLHELLRTNMVIMASTPIGSSFETSYELSELARQYLSNRHPIDSKEHENFTRKNRQIIAAEEQFKANQESDPYSFYSLQMRSKKDLIVAKSLLEALKEAKNKGFIKAEGLIAEAKRLAPEYFEVFRVEAVVKLQQNNYTAAQTAYEQAIELEPLSAPLRKWYGSFLLRYFDDCEASLVQLEKASEIDPKSIETQIELARVKLYLSRFDDATSMLKIILSWSGIGIWPLRKAYDLYFQCFLRRAEYYITKHDEINAIKNLEMFKEAFDSCPSNIIDNLMIFRLKVATEHAESCNNIAPNDETRGKAMSLIEELTKEYQAATGAPPDIKTNESEDYSEENELISNIRTEGIISSLKESYGFIKDYSGNSYFFHRSDLPSRSEWRYLKKGEKVSFFIGSDPKNPRGRQRAYRVIVEKID